MPNKTLRLLFLYNGFFVLASSLLGPLYAVYVAGFDSSTKVMSVSLSWAVFLFSTTLFTYLLSKIGDKFRQKRLFLAGGYLIRAICWFLMGYIGTLSHLIYLQFILGIGEALGTPAFDAIFAEHLDRNHHIMDYSDWKVISNGILVVGTVLGGFVVTTYGFVPLFVFMSSLAFVSFFGVLFNKSLD